MKPVNVLYLHCHDLGRYCEPFGYAIPASGTQPGRRSARKGHLDAS